MPPSAASVAGAPAYGAPDAEPCGPSHRGGVEIFTEPFEGGYRQRSSVPLDGEVQVPHRLEATLAVADLLDAEE